MRDELITYFKTLSLGTFSVSDELPYDKDGQPLHFSNYKKIYVDNPSTAQEGLLNTLDGGSIVNETTTLTAYLVVDAKTLPTNYGTVVTALINGKNNVNIEAKINRTCSVSKSYDVDALLTELTFSFTKLLTT
jgi:hypothetical protein